MSRGTLYPEKGISRDLFFSSPRPRTSVFCSNVRIRRVKADVVLHPGKRQEAGNTVGLQSTVHEFTQKALKLQL